MVSPAGLTVVHESTYSTRGPVSILRMWLLVTRDCGGRRGRWTGWCAWVCRERVARKPAELTSLPAGVARRLQHATCSEEVDRDQGSRCALRSHATLAALLLDSHWHRRSCGWTVCIAKYSKLFIEISLLMFVCVALILHFRSRKPRKSIQI